MDRIGLSQEVQKIAQENTLFARLLYVVHCYRRQRGGGVIGSKVSVFMPPNPTLPEGTDISARIRTVMCCGWGILIPPGYQHIDPNGQHFVHKLPSTKSLSNPWRL